MEYAEPDPHLLLIENDACDLVDYCLAREGLLLPLLDPIVDLKQL